MKSSSDYNKGKFRPKHPEKYRGNVNNIIFRSSWELSFARFLDNNIRVLEWSSESIVIPYVKFTDNRVHKYYPDFYVKYKDKNNNIKQEIIEIKPAHEKTSAMFILESNFKLMLPSRSKRKKTKEQQLEAALINASKWAYAIEWCKKRNVAFKIITENDHMFY